MDVTITKISETKKGRFALFCGDDFLFSIEPDQLARHEIHEGTVLTEFELDRLRSESESGKALRKGLDYLALRDHAKRELRDKLMRKYDAPTADQTIAKLEELGYLNDGVFAQRYSAELMDRRGLSRRETARRLEQKGIGREQVGDVLAQYDEDETAKIRALIEKKYAAKLAAGKGPAVYNALVARGFSPRDVRAVLRDYTETPEESFD